MRSYKEIVKHILTNGEVKHNRTGVDTLAIAGTMFQHNMKNGFPLLTTKFVPFRTMAVELEGFIKGITDKGWYQERKCKIWNEWCSPAIVPYGNDERTKKLMMEENDLGPLYGWQWRHWNGSYRGHNHLPSFNPINGIDQLRNVINKLKTDPDDRRMIVSAWNPEQIKDMALPPCHYGFQVTVINGKLNLMWNQRSVDTALGLPFNIASYALLLILLAKESGFEPGTLTGFLGDTHIYVNHINGLTEQIQRASLKPPTLKFKKFTSIFDFEHTDVVLCDYSHHEPIKFEIAV